MDFASTLIVILGGFTILMGVLTALDRRAKRWTEDKFRKLLSAMSEGYNPDEVAQIVGKSKGSCEVVMRGVEDFLKKKGLFGESVLSQMMKDILKGLNNKEKEDILKGLGAKEHLGLQHIKA